MIDNIKDFIDAVMLLNNKKKNIFIKITRIDNKHIIYDIGWDGETFNNKNFIYRNLK
jgi:hypothetical protein